MSLTPMAAVREAPADVLARLREVDRTAALVYLGLGQWALGSVQPSTYRAMQARVILARFDQLPAVARSPGKFLFTRMLEEGFRPVSVYSEREVQNGDMIRDFRERDWNYRNRQKEAFEAAMRRVDGSENVDGKIIRILDAVHTEFPSAMRFARGRRGVLNPGIN